MFPEKKLKLNGNGKKSFFSVLRRIHPGTVCIVVGVAAIAVAAAIWIYNDRIDRQAAESSRAKAEILLDIIRYSDAANAETGSAQTDAAFEAPVVYAPDADLANAGIPEEDIPDIPADAGASYVVVEREAYMGILSIPSFGLNLPVNITWSYPKLRSTPCRYTGSVERNDLVIAAHSYRSHFGNIHTLAQGDAVVFTDVEGRVFNYHVVTVETVKPTDARNVVISPYDLTLFTCTYDSKARVVVRCNKDEVPDLQEEPEEDTASKEAPEEVPEEAPEEVPAAQTDPAEETVPQEADADET